MLSKAGAGPLSIRACRPRSFALSKPSHDARQGSLGGRRGSQTSWLAVSHSLWSVILQCTNRSWNADRMGL